MNFYIIEKNPTNLPNFLVSSLMFQDFYNMGGNLMMLLFRFPFIQKHGWLIGPVSTG